MFENAIGALACFFKYRTRHWVHYAFNPLLLLSAFVCLGCCLCFPLPPLMKLLREYFTAWYLYLTSGLQLLLRVLNLPFTRHSVSCCVCLTVIVDFFFCVQRAPPHQIGDATLPRSDPNLSAPDKGKNMAWSVYFCILRLCALKTAHVLKTLWNT